MLARLPWLGVVSAVLYVGGFAGVDWWPLSLVCLVPLCWALDKVRSFSGALRLGLVFGAVVNLLGYYFLFGTLHRFSGFGVLASLGVYLAICVYQGGQLALFTALWWRARALGGDGLVVAPFAYAACEAVYPLLFPTYLGNALHDVPVAIQIAELGGPTSISLLIVAINASVCALARRDLRGGQLRALLLATALATAASLVYGAIRIDQIDAAAARAPKLTVGLVQGDTGLFQRREDRALARRRYIEQSQRLLSREPALDLLVWPESALLYPIREGARDVESLVGSLGVPVLFGAISVDPEARVSPHNTAFLASATGRLQGHVHKTHLLPFGEYIPFGDVFPWLYELSPYSGRYAKGDGRTTVRLGGRPLTVLICYEDVLPAFVRRALGSGGGQLLVNLTNDAWFGETSEPYIHLALAKFRAIEHRRYLLRATGTGISAVVDPVGRVVTRSELSQRTELIARVSWLEGTTPFARLGDWPGIGSVLVMLWVSRPRSRSRGVTSSG